MADSNIEWTQKVWNPIRGCSRVSPGCLNCYAERQAHRFSGPGQPYEGLTTIRNGRPGWTGKVRAVSEMLDAPLHWRKPCRIFVNSMSDLFHEKVTDEEIAAVYGVMAVASQRFYGSRVGGPQNGPHTFQILTKRPLRARALLSDWRFRRSVASAAYRHAMDRTDAGWLAQCVTGVAEPGNHCTLDKLWPLPNVHLGVSCEDQPSADARIPLLLETPAAVRFVSCEPLLGPIDFRLVPGFNRVGLDLYRCWIIVGGESGPGARLCDVKWIRSIVSQCKTAGVPCFVKQLGANAIDSSRCDVWADGEHHYTRDPDDPVVGEARERPGYTVTAHNLSRVLGHRSGADPSEWPPDLRVRQWPRASAAEHSRAREGSARS